MKWSVRLLVIFFSLFLLTGNSAWAGFKFEYNDQTKGEIGFWGQAWYQYVGDGNDSDDDGIDDSGLNDFMLRRAYLYIKGQMTPYFSFFTHIASDRLGQQGLDDSSNGLGSGVAIRDMWITLNLHEAFKVQVGRMYIPFTRNYGTTSTKALLTTDLDWTQGGIRSNIFYPSKVGRDDAATLWGNIKGGLVQYRFMVGDGAESASANPDDNLRFAGRISVSLFDPETAWFNPGTYLGKKRVLSLGGGADYQKGLMFADEQDDYFAWTADVFYDQPLGDFGAVTFEGAYINIDNGPNSITYTQFSPGSDGYVVSLKAGYLFLKKLWVGQFQPFAHWQYIGVDEDGRDGTNVYGCGLNYYIKGVANKISLDFAYVDQKEEIVEENIQDHFIFTFQLAAGF